MHAQPRRHAGSRPIDLAWHRALPTLVALVVAVLCVAAGNWQRARMQQKEQLAQALHTAQERAPVNLPRGIVDWQPWQFRVVDAQGRYDPGRQILIDNRVHGGRVGYDVVTPFALGDGRVILVNRGFAPGGKTRIDLPRVPPPAGEVSVRGRLRLPSADYVELDDAAPDGSVWQNLDPVRFAKLTGVAVLPVIIEQIQGPGDGLERDWPRPDAGTDKHRIYMVQWYAFAALTGGLWVWFTFVRRAK